MTQLTIGDLKQFIENNKSHPIVDPTNPDRIFVCHRENNFVSIDVINPTCFRVIYCDDNKNPLLFPSAQNPKWNSGCVSTTSFQVVLDLINSKNEGKHYV